MKPVSDFIVLGSAVNSPPDAWRTLSHRMRATWKSWSGIRNQVRAHRISLHLRAQLLEGAVLPALLWGLETWCLTRPQRDKLSTIHRVMIGRMLKIFQKPKETHCDFFRRRERCRTAAITTHCRAKWGQLQRFRWLTFAGHVQRADDSHDVKRITSWRDSHWWASYRERLPAKRGGQKGRRPADKSLPFRQEVAIRRAMHKLRDRPCGPSIAAALRQARVERADKTMPRQDMTQIRGAWRAFARWAAFRAEL